MKLRACSHMLQRVRLSEWLGIALVKWVQFVFSGLAYRVSNTSNLTMHSVKVSLIGNEDRQEQTFACLLDRRQVFRDCCDLLC